jgi:SAM-dependent methyltransferase
MLDTYLVSGYQDPRINLQSILLRHALARRLFGDGLPALMDDEIRIAIALNDRLRLHALERGVPIGSYLDPSKHQKVVEIAGVIEDGAGALGPRWIQALQGRPSAPLRVVEFACGSANDFRSWVAYGLAAHIDYTGIDLNPTNIDNARRRFPDVDFRVGSVLAVGLPDASADLVVASDILEHLSIAAMEQTLAEAIRLTRDGLIINFFSMDDIAEHVVTSKGLYQWNRLSRARLEARLTAEFLSVEVVSIARWLAATYDHPYTYNDHAWTMTAGRHPHQDHE